MTARELRKCSTRPALQVSARENVMAMLLVAVVVVQMRVLLSDGCQLPVSHLSCQRPLSHSPTQHAITAARRSTQSLATLDVALRRCRALPVHDRPCQSSQVSHVAPCTDHTARLLHCSTRTVHAASVDHNADHITLSYILRTQHAHRTRHAPFHSIPPAPAPVVAKHCTAVSSRHPYEPSVGRYFASSCLLPSLLSRHARPSS